MIERQSPQTLGELWWCWCTYDHFTAIWRFVLALFLFLLTFFFKDWAVILLKVILGESFMFGRVYWMSYFFNMYSLSGSEKIDTFSYRNYFFWTRGLISEPVLLRATPKLSSLLGYCLRISIAAMNDHGQKESWGGKGLFSLYFYFAVHHGSKLGHDKN